MPASPAPRPEPDRPEADPAKPRKFRHQAPIEADADGVVERGHGSGCIPIILIRFSFLALMVWLAMLIAGLIASRQLDHARPAAPVVRSQP